VRTDGNDRDAGFAAAWPFHRSRGSDAVPVEPAHEVDQSGLIADANQCPCDLAITTPQSARITHQTRHSFSDLVDHLVCDRILPLGNFAHADFGFALPSPENNLVPLFDAFDIGHVGHGQVHADPTDYGRTPSPDEHLGVVRQAATVAIGIADGEDSDLARPSGDKRLAVAHWILGRQLLHLQDESPGA
jgi:hypothetical protein